MANFSGLGSATAAYWFQFFLDAGIPPADAGNYAVTFTENRIKEDMIVDLTKDYLNEMGVTVLGDMIAILKHAKHVHTQSTIEKVLQNSGLSAVPSATCGVSQLGLALKPSLPTRMSLPVKGSLPTKVSLPTEVYPPTKVSIPIKISTPIRPPHPANDQSLETSEKAPFLSSKAANNLLQDKTSVQFGSSKKAEEMKLPVRKTSNYPPNVAATNVCKGTAQDADAKRRSSAIVRLKEPEAEAGVYGVLVPKVRKVTREQEGRYKIIYPSGVIKSKQKNTTEQKKEEEEEKEGVVQPSSSSSVFDRLGDERVGGGRGGTGGGGVEAVEGSSVDRAVSAVNFKKSDGNEHSTSLHGSPSVALQATSSVFCRLGKKHDLKRTMSKEGVEDDSVLNQSMPLKKARKAIEDRLGPLKVGAVSSPSAGVLTTTATSSSSIGTGSDSTRTDDRPVHLRLGNKCAMPSNSNNTVTSFKPVNKMSLSSAAMVAAASAAAAAAAAAVNSCERKPKICQSQTNEDVHQAKSVLLRNINSQRGGTGQQQKVTFSSPSTMTRSFSHRLGPPNVRSDSAVQLKSRNPAAGGVCAVIRQAGSSTEVESSAHQSSIVSLRSTKPGDVTLRLGRQGLPGHGVQSPEQADRISTARRLNPKQESKKKKVPTATLR